MLTFAAESIMNYVRKSRFKM